MTSPMVVVLAGKLAGYAAVAIRRSHRKTENKLLERGTRRKGPPGQWGATKVSTSGKGKRVVGKGKQVARISAKTIKIHWNVETE